MKNIIHRFYVLWAIVGIVMALSLYFQFGYFNKILTEETQMHTVFSRDTIRDDISNSLIAKGHVITDLAGYIKLQTWDREELLAYMKNLMKENPHFSSIYFGTKDNVMFNGSGWVPPKTFDLRTRRWYIKAASEQKLIFTEAFLNASKDKMIITIAKPVYDSNNNLIGVISGDVSIKDILSIVQNKKITGEGYSFLIDGKGNILAHPQYEYNPEKPLTTVDDVSEEISKYLSQDKAGIKKVFLDGNEGYLAYQSIENTDWKICSFIPLNEYMSKNTHFLLIFIITLITTLGVFIIFLMLLRNHHIRPMLALDRDIRIIDMRQDMSYRLPIKEKEGFYVLRKSINSVLNKTEELFHKLEIEEKKLEYLSYNDQLTGLYNRRFFEEELNRLDVERNLPITLILGDVNGLKLINDSFGHLMGDDLLKKVAEAIKKGCREDDIIARLGGDEFVVLLPKTDALQAEQIVKRIKTVAADEKIGSMDLSISFGFQTKTNAEETMREVFKKAEDYMYREKLFESPSMRGKTINAIINTLHEKNEREEQHSQRVSELSKSIGKAIGLTEREVQELKTAGLLHDIGKIAIDEKILNKPGKLTKNEWQEIKQHPEKGYRILSTVNDMSEIADYVLFHHERWDGKGYPKGLKGKEIPLMSRILSVADAYDAMTSSRSYRNKMDEEIAIEELRKNVNIQFDPEIVSVFIEKVLKK